MPETKICEGLNKSAQIIHKNNVAKGFYEKQKNIPEMLCLIHSEVSEALEADRKGVEGYSAIDEEEMNEIEVDILFKETYDIFVKGTFEEEMSDIIIRVLDLCAFLNIDIEQHIRAKVRYNSLREYKHGKKY